MPIDEMRKDYILDRWVVIASQRRRRPTDFIKARESGKPSICPFCPGNEPMTPPAVLVYRQADGKIVKDEDSDGFRHKDWLVRCFPNLYPAFKPPKDGEAIIRQTEHFESMEALGHHEVIVESPEHDEHPGAAGISQMILVINAYKDRLSYLTSRRYVKYVSIFRNHGLDAGASLSHAHTQVIATPVLPSVVMEELNKSKSFWDDEERCIFCDVVEKERSSPRLIWENDKFAVLAPWAGVHPFEFWIFPKRHQPTLLDVTSGEIEELAATLRFCFGGLRSLLGDPSYNFGFHMVPAEHYHWHIEVCPRLSIWAGFEKSTGMFINVVPPEEASSSLRGAIQREQDELKS